MGDNMSDIEIAREAHMLPIAKVAERVGLDPAWLEPYGSHKAKLDVRALRGLSLGCLSARSKTLSMQCITYRAVASGW